MGLAFCTDLSRALGAAKSTIRVSVPPSGASLEEAAATSSIGDFSSSDAGEATGSIRSSVGGALGSDLVEMVGEIGVGIGAVGVGAAARGWGLFESSLTCRCMSARSDIILSSRAVASVAAVVAAVAAAAAVWAARVALFVAIWVMLEVSRAKAAALSLACWTSILD